MDFFSVPIMIGMLIGALIWFTVTHLSIHRELIRDIGARQLAERELDLIKQDMRHLCRKITVDDNDEDDSDEIDRLIDNEDDDESIDETPAVANCPSDSSTGNPLVDRLLDVFPTATITTHEMGELAFYYEAPVPRASSVVLQNDIIYRLSKLGQRLKPGYTASASCIGGFLEPITPKVS